MGTPDVIIIGGGPAGSSAALWCHKAGLRCLVVTDGWRNGLAPGAPSESLHPGVLQLLAQIGAEHCAIAATRSTYEATIVNGQYNPLGSDERGPWRGLHIDRYLFGTAMLDSVRQRGIPVIPGTVAGLLQYEERTTGVVLTNGELFTARYVIVACGQRKMAGLPFKTEYHSPPLAVWTGRAQGLPPAHPLFAQSAAHFIPAPGGWAWLAPEPPHCCTWTRMARHGGSFAPPDVLQPFEPACPVHKWNRRWRILRPVCKEGLLLCGDAAAILDPAAGQGILSAIRSAGMAVKTIHACLRQPHLEALHLAEYDGWLAGDYFEKVARLKGYYAELGIGVFGEE